MPYDAKLDQCIFSKAWENDQSRIVVGVFSYNQGQKKIQISRENKNADGDYAFAKLGRMTKEELTAVLPSLQEALSKME